VTPRHYNDDTLEGIARHIISKYDASLLHSIAPIPIERIMEVVYGLNLDFQFIRNNGRILGETIFEDMMVAIYERENGEGYKLIPVKAGTVIIDASLIDIRWDGRYHYTLAHELAHWVIHKCFYKALGEAAAMTKAARSSETDKAIEWQADRLANYLLMPKGIVKMAFYRSRTERNVVGVLAETFGVSRQAMEIRLREMRLL
jgi:Zn-dependent peptidase ImmA (M78 family)